MPKRTQRNESVPFHNVDETSRLTGISTYALRRSIKSGICPHIRVGNAFLINVPALLKQLEAGGIIF